MAIQRLRILVKNDHMGVKLSGKVRFFSPFYIFWKILSYPTRYRHYTELRKGTGTRWEMLKLTNPLQAWKLLETSNSDEKVTFWPSFRGHSGAKIFSKKIRGSFKKKPKHCKNTQEHIQMFRKHFYVCCKNFDDDWRYRKNFMIFWKTVNTKKKVFSLGLKELIVKRPPKWRSKSYFLIRIWCLQ